MPEIPAGRTVRVFAVPLAAYAAALADLPAGEPALEASMWRVLSMSAALTVFVWFASAADNGRGGAWSVIAGIAMTAMTAGALSFAAALGLLIAFSGSLDAFIAVAAACFIAFLLLMGAFLVYINASISGVGWKHVAAATAAQCAILTALILSPHRTAAIAASAIAGTACLISLVRDRRAAKKEPA